MKLKGAEILIQCLKEQGVDTIFGYPGGAVLDIYDALYRDGSINHILTAHEQGASHAADGYARVTGRTGVCFATSGPGATNLVTGIATAMMDSVPMVAVTGNVGISMLGRDSFQEVDITGITMPITKHNFIVKDVTELADTIRKAFYIAESGRKGPVLIDILKNVQVAECEYEPQKPRHYHQVPVFGGKLYDIADVLNTCERPLIMAGGGVIASEASDLVKELAEKLDAPVTYTLMGKGAVSDTDARNVGMIGMHGTVTSARTLIEADTVIALGTRFSDRVALNRNLFANGKKVIHVDIDNAEIGKNIPASYSVMADVKETLKTLLPLIKESKKPEWTARIAEFAALNDKMKDKTQLPYLILKEAGERMPAECALVTDVGQHQMWAAQDFPVRLPRRFCSSGGLGTMGYGMGAAIGACYGTGKPSVLVTGDGCFNMNMNELSTAVTYGVPLVILLMNNGVLGMVRQWQKIFYGNRFSQTTLQKKTDYIKFAESFGAKGIVIDNAACIRERLQEAFTYAQENCAPVLVDCRISCDENVFPMIKPGATYDTQMNSMEEK